MPDSLWTLGDVVRKLRLNRRWTQAELAERAGLNKSTVIELERESHTSEQRTIHRVAKVLQISVADLYAYAQTASLSVEQREWVTLLGGLEPPRREIVLALARREREVQETAPRSTPSADRSATGTEGDRKSRQS